MATDATGTPTSPDGLAKINPSVDAPSGVGQNSLADSIQTALTNNYPRKPAGIVSGEVPVWDGSAWVRSSVTNIGPTSLGSGTPDSTKFLRGDGSWQVVATASTVNVQTGTTYTGVLGDANNIVTMSNASASTFTIPANSSVAYAVGTSITIIQLGAGQVTIGITTDTLNGSPGLTIAAQYGVATVVKVATTTWVAMGNLTA